MARAPGRPCRDRSCPEIVSGKDGYCEEHRSEKWSGDDRPPASERGYGHHHRKWREAVLSKDPICRHCEQEGRTRVSVIADHIVPWQEDGSKYALSNGQGLCRACHNRKHANA